MHKRMNPMITLRQIAACMVFCVLCAACGASQDNEGDLCGVGDAITVDDEVVCVYDRRNQEIIETGFTCPSTHAHEHEFGALIVCTSNPLAPPGLEDVLRREFPGYDEAWQFPGPNNGNPPTPVTPPGPDTPPETPVGTDPVPSPDPDLPNEDACEAIFPEPPAQDCDPIAQQGCPAGIPCIVAVEGSTMERRFVCMQSSRESALPAGSTCEALDAQACEAGTHCILWLGSSPQGRICSSFCKLGSEEDCGSDAYCTHHGTMPEGYGLCVDRCDPYDAEACPAGQACSPDSGNAGELACLGEFRCLTNAEPNPYLTPDYGITCDVNRLHQEEYACPAGDICYPVGGNQQCVSPCTTDGDCSDLGSEAKCLAASGPHGLRFCQASCIDADGDGYYAHTALCPAGRDCDDNDPAVNPGAMERCDGKDTNCDGFMDAIVSSHSWEECPDGELCGPAECNYQPVCVVSNDSFYCGD